MDRKVIIGIIMLLAASCNKQGADDNAVEYIRFDAGVADTRSLIESEEDLKAEGNVLTIYDVHTKSDGNMFQYMNGVPVVYSEGNWTFSDGEIPWTRRGSHHFLAYLSEYQGVPSLSTEYYSDLSERAEYQYLLVSAEHSPDNGQYDFMYASAVRDVERDGIGTVLLEMKHLFASASFMIRNMSGLKMTVESFELQGMRVQGEALIGFGANPVISLEEAPDENDFSISGLDIDAEYKEPVNLYGDPFLIWPHKSDYYKDIVCSMTYKLGTNSSKTVELNLTAANTNIVSWDAGSRYTYTITISDVIFLDVVRVVDWINDDVILQQ